MELHVSFILPSVTMKPQPRLQDMPYLVKRRIVKKNMEYYDQMSLRTACPSEFHFIPQDLLFHCDTFQLTDSDSEIQMSLGEVFQKTYSHLELAARDFKMLVDNPNFSAEKFEIAVANASFLIQIGWILQKVKLKVKRFQMSYGKPEEVLLILPYLDSEYLETVKLRKLHVGSALPGG